MGRYVRDHFGIGVDGKTHLRLIHDTETDALLAAEFGQDTDRDGLWTFQLAADAVDELVAVWTAALSECARSEQKFISDEQADHCRDHHEWEGTSSCPQCEMESQHA